MKPTMFLLVALAGVPVAGCSSTAPGAKSTTAAAESADGGDLEVPTPAALLASCAVSVPTSCTDASLHFGDIEAIIQKSCSPCHTGGTDEAPWSLTRYQDVVDWAQVTRADLIDCEMPPLDGGVGISASDRLKILTWLRCGEPQ